MKPKVDFVIIGAQKAGTSTLFHLLNQHPQLCGSSFKEPEFFIEGSHFGSKYTMESYHDLFKKEEGQLAFEASTNYAAYPHSGETWKNLHAYNPDLKIIYLIRNPLERILSAHRFAYKRGNLPKEKRNINSNLKSNDYIINLTKYFTQVSPFIETFGNDKILILFNEDLSQNRPLLLKKASEFLNIDAFGESDLPEVKINTKDNYRPPKSIRKALMPFYRQIVKVYPNFQLAGWAKKLLRKTTERTFNDNDLRLEESTLDKLGEILLPEIEGIEHLSGRDLSIWKKSFPQMDDVR